MAVVYETEVPHGTPTGRGPYREADDVGRERTAILGRRLEGAPDTMVEVLSPATGRRDLGEKLRLYAESGVAEYWIVDPDLETLELLENAPDGSRVRLPEGSIYRSAALAGLELDLEACWRALPS